MIDGVAVEAHTSDLQLARLRASQDVLVRVSRTLGPAHDLGLALRTVLGAMRDLVEFRGGSIGIVERGYVRIAAADPDVSPEVARARVPLGEGIAGRIVTEARTIYVPDLDHDHRVDPRLRRLGSNAGMRSYLGVPLVCLGAVIGVLQVDAAEPAAFDVDDVQLLEWLATHVAGAIEGARTYERLRELEQLKSDFVSRVSHELRTPLTVVRGFVETLVAKPEEFDDERRHDILTRVALNAERLEHLIEELLALSAFEAGTRAVQSRTVRIADLLESMASHLVVVGPVPPDLVIWTDAELARSAIALVVDNAAKYAGGARVDVEPHADGHIDVLISDGGPGIPEPVLHHAFERFVRGPATTPGLGLGLYRTRRIADALHAELEVTCPPGRGTVVRLGFPIDPRAVAREQPIP